MSVPNNSGEMHSAHDFTRDQLRGLNHHREIELGEKDPVFGTILAQSAHFSHFPLGKVTGSFWERENAYGTIAVLPGAVGDPVTKKHRLTAIPHGGLPRLLTAHITSEARRIHKAGGDPKRIDLTESLNAMVRQLGLSEGSRNGAVMRALEDTLSARVSFTRADNGEHNGQKGKWQHTVWIPQIASQLSLWVPSQDPLAGFEPYVELSNDYLDMVLDDRLVLPVRTDILAQLAGKPMAFDLLLWLSNVTYSLHRGNLHERFFSWQELFTTVTHEYERQDNFVTYWKRALTETLRYYPDANVEIVRGTRGKPGGVSVKRSRLLIDQKRRIIGS